MNFVKQRGWLVGLGATAVVLFGIAPVALDPFQLNLLGKFLCFAIVAAGIGLAWGRGGMLVLGQGVFFGIGAYFMGMNLKISDAQLKGNAVPDFMQISGIPQLPGYWQPFSSLFGTVLLIAIVPPLLAVILGLGVFKRKVKGAYFAILSQALAGALAIYLVGQQSIGGSNGLNGFQSFLGLSLYDPLNKQMLFFIASGALLLILVANRQLMVSRYGELLVAVRDQEERVRFLGYDPANVKIVAYAIGAFYAGIAGALFVPIVGFITPSDVDIAPSIAFVIGVAIGGRTTLFGPVIGAIAVGWAQSYLSEAWPTGWSFIQGALFIVVVGFFPAGLAGITALRWHRKKKAEAPPPAALPEAQPELVEEMAR